MEKDGVLQGKHMTELRKICVASSCLRGTYTSYYRTTRYVVSFADYCVHELTSLVLLVLVVVICVKTWTCRCGVVLFSFKSACNLGGVHFKNIFSLFLLIFNFNHTHFYPIAKA